MTEKGSALNIILCSTEICCLPNFGKKNTDASVFRRLNFFPNDNFLDWSKLKALAYDKINVTENLKFVLGRAEKGENAG